ncbi:MAG: glutamine--fructose-6-phosphate transaminase (isomerizing) [Clostridia bacterium]|nr:glutamine--fructose-6-phosphate transaminase (isomerizing) [Clostridia bacterium]
MCGIVGYAGNKDTISVLLHGLEKLEYRGYDSAGIAYLENGEIKVSKCKGRLINLQEKLADRHTENIGTGIGHTRWATHGEPNDINSHPHLSKNNQFCIVHNGIIENYISLRDNLIREGYHFESNTDSEVITHLLHFNYNGEMIETILKTINQLEGSYALAIICKDHDDKVFCVRKESPLIVGSGTGENFIASDIPAILKYTREIFIMEDNEIAIIDKDNITFFNSFGSSISKNEVLVTWDEKASEKGGFEHFMLKEIHEEPESIRKTINPRIKNNHIVLEGITLEKPKKIAIVACGTAYHAGVVGKYLIEKLLRIPVEVDIASEFRYREPIIDEDTLTIIISQSGETIDTLFALRKAREKGSRILSIVNVVGSSIARESDDVLYTWAGPEIAVASTKAYSTQLSAIYLITLMMYEGKDKELLISQLKDIPDQISKVIKDMSAIQKASSLLFGSKSIFFIGRGLDYALSMEGSLKLKEISYIHSEAYAGGELKHGTIALIEEGTPVICSLTQHDLIDKMISNIREVKARGAYVMVITQESHCEQVKEVADMIVMIPEVNPVFSPVIAVVPMQLFAYFCSVEKGNDVDKPRNLAKSVTVE